MRYQLAEPRCWQGQLRCTLTARAIQGSNSIEGYQVSLDDAEDVVGHEPAGGPGSVPPEIVGYRDALTYVRQLADHPYFRYERMLLSALHFLMLGRLTLDTRVRPLPRLTSLESCVTLSRISLGVRHVRSSAMWLY